MKRQPSAPWLGWLVVTGMSASVMPMRSTVSAEALVGMHARASVAVSASTAAPVLSNIDLVMGISCPARSLIGRRSTQRNGENVGGLGVFAEHRQSRRLRLGDSGKLGRARYEDAVRTLNTDTLNERGHLVC